MSNRTVGDPHRKRLAKALTPIVELLFAEYDEFKDSNPAKAKRHHDAATALKEYIETVNKEGMTPLQARQLDLAKRPKPK